MVQTHGGLVGRCQVRCKKQKVVRYWLVVRQIKGGLRVALFLFRFKMVR